MINDFLKKLRTKFKNKNLFDTALTHRSWVNEHPRARDHNERLEFLGDAVLELVVSEKLYLKFPYEKEGFMTSLRANLVNTVNLSNVAKKIAIGQEIFLSKGEEDGGGRINQSLLANSVEALIGAIYLDQGLSNADKFITENLISQIDEKLTKPLKDAKSRLQELLQSQGFATPRYKVVKEAGPDHAKEFTVQVHVKDEVLGKGSGKSKAEAEQSAAENSLVNFPSSR